MADDSPDGLKKALSIQVMVLINNWQFTWCFNQVGLKGEALSLHSLSGSSAVEWGEGSFVAERQPLTWYKVFYIL